MSDLKQLQKHFLETLGKELAPFGFKKRHQAFIREVKAAERADSIEIALVARPPATEVQATLGLGMRHHRLEELANGWRTDVSPAELRKMFTLYIPLQNVLGRRSLSWLFSSPAQADAAVQDIITKLNSGGLQHFEQMGDENRVLTWWLSDDPAAWHAMYEVRFAYLPALLVLRGCVEEAQVQINAMVPRLRAERRESVVDDLRGWIAARGSEFGLTMPS